MQSTSIQLTACLNSVNEFMEKHPKWISRFRSQLSLTDDGAWESLTRFKSVRAHLFDPNIVQWMVDAVEILKGITISAQKRRDRTTVFFCLLYVLNALDDRLSRVDAPHTDKYTCHECGESLNQCERHRLDQTTLIRDTLETYVIHEDDFYPYKWGPVMSHLHICVFTVLLDLYKHNCIYIIGRLISLFYSTTQQ